MEGRKRSISSDLSNQSKDRKRNDSDKAETTSTLHELPALDERCHRNPFLSYPDISFDSVRIRHDIEVFLSSALPKLEECLKTSSKSCNIYAGQLGIAMAVWKAQRELQANPSYPMPNLPEISSPHQGLSMHGIGLCCDRLCYDLYHRLRRGELFAGDAVWYQHPDAVNELLYGRAGYAVLLRYFQCKGLRVADPDIVQRVLDSIPMQAFPWQWHGKAYFGGAHGTAGILHTLKEIGQRDHSEEVLKFIIMAKFSSGNFKSSLESKSDRLVQWCHGATGVLPLLLAYRDILDVQKTIDEAIDIIWRRGLLQKGCGICHGAAGNAYAFLAAYKCLLRPDHLQKAVAFAEIILAEGPDTCCSKSDTPYSLFEGLAGTVMFLVDLWKILQLQGNAAALQEYQLFDGLEIF